jgi:hypothetical protein
MTALTTAASVSINENEIVDTIEESELRYFRTSYGDSHGYNERAKTFHRTYGLITSRDRPEFQPNTANPAAKAPIYRIDNRGLRREVDFEPKFHYQLPTENTKRYKDMFIQELRAEKAKQTARNAKNNDNNNTNNNDKKLDNSTQNQKSHSTNMNSNNNYNNNNNNSNLNNGTTHNIPYYYPQSAYYHSQPLPRTKPYITKLNFTNVTNKSNDNSNNNTNNYINKPVVKPISYHPDFMPQKPSIANNNSNILHASIPIAQSIYCRPIHQAVTKPNVTSYQNRPKTSFN